MREQCVGECHRRGPGADHEIVRFELVGYHLAMIFVVAQGAPNGIELSRLASPRIHSNARVDAGLARSAPASC
jgi:hypothetical protein